MAVLVGPLVQAVSTLAGYSPAVVHKPAIEAFKKISEIMKGMLLLSNHWTQLNHDWSNMRPVVTALITETRIQAKKAKFT